MELLLNLSWLMLALPAYWVWRREVEFGRGCERRKSLRGVMVLGCILTLLFPVISATDDLHFIRPEMEESASSKRALKQAASDRASTSLKTAIIPPAAATEVSSFPACTLRFRLLAKTTRNAGLRLLFLRSPLFQPLWRRISFISC
jgi:hypothetical protein